MYQKMTSEVIYYDDSLGKNVLLCVGWFVTIRGDFYSIFWPHVTLLVVQEILFKVLENFLLEEFWQVG